MPRLWIITEVTGWIINTPTSLVLANFINGFSTEVAICYVYLLLPGRFYALDAFIRACMLLLADGLKPRLLLIICHADTMKNAHWPLATVIIARAHALSVTIMRAGLIYRHSNAPTLRMPTLVSWSLSVSLSRRSSKTWQRFILVDGDDEAAKIIAGVRDIAMIWAGENARGSGYYATLRE